MGVSQLAYSSKQFSGMFIANLRIAAPSARIRLSWFGDESEQGDWRLPTRLELEELLNKLREDQKPFTEVQEEYWSSTTDLEDKAFGWLVPVAGDEVYTVKKDEEHDVWPVRGPKWSP